MKVNTNIYIAHEENAAYLIQTQYKNKQGN